MNKCPSCGSRQFKVIASRSICVYCRNEQDAVTPAQIEVTSLGDSAPRFIDQWQANSLSLRAERYIDFFGTDFVRYSRNLIAAKEGQA